MQKLHSKVDAIKVTVGDWKVTRDSRASGDNHGVVLTAEGIQGDIAVADMATSNILDSLGTHEVNTPLHNLLVKLHVRDAVHEKTPNAIGALVHRHLVAALVELVGGSEPSWA